ncbi:MAG: phosphoribosylaminoimidazolesuccinocarboxamide synthase [Patescibacteria group bacterium]
MKKINPRLLALPLFILLATKLNELTVGKVRNSYALPSFPDLRLIVATDRISIFDFILNLLISLKGSVLTAMTIDWLLNVFADIPNHLVAYGAAIDKYLPEELRGNADLQSRGMIVLNLRMLPIEFVVRGYLGGSGWKSYQATREVCGILLPEGLTKGCKLSTAIATPTTKSEDGHDKHLTFGEMLVILGAWLRENGINRDPKQLAQEAVDLSLKLYDRGSDYAKSKKIILFDTKFEFGLNANNELVAADEILTPDSSRFIEEEKYNAAMAAGTNLETSDKEYVRAIGAKVPTPFFYEKGEHKGEQIIGIDNLDPENEAHVNWVSELEWPEETVEETTNIYLKICGQMLGKPLVQFQREDMFISVN